MDEQTEYVVLHAHMRQQVQERGDPDDLDIREAYPLMDAVAAKEGWEDSDLDSYNTLSPGHLS